MKAQPVLAKPAQLRTTSELVWHNIGPYGSSGSNAFGTFGEIGFDSKGNIVLKYYYLNVQQLQWLRASIITPVVVALRVERLRASSGFTNFVCS